MTSGGRGCCDPLPGAQGDAEGQQSGEQVRDQTSLHAATLCLAPFHDNPSQDKWPHARCATSAKGVVPGDGDKHSPSGVPYEPAKRIAPVCAVRSLAEHADSEHGRSDRSSSGQIGHQGPFGRGARVLRRRDRPVRERSDREGSPLDAQTGAASGSQICR
jgi:hypothetical protein